MIEKLGGRKFVMAVVLLVLNFILFYVGKIDGKTWEWLSTSLFGIYVGGNVVTKFTQ
jgi:hypothetical protein